MAKLTKPDATKNNILAAVREILLEEGYTGLYIRNIARKAKTSGKMIYYHFGSLEQLLDIYINETDYWKGLDKAFATEEFAQLRSQPKDLMTHIFRAHYESFEKSEEMQKLILWEVSKYSDSLRKDSDAREAYGERVYEIVDPIFKDKDLDFRSVSAIITAGVYYLIMHAKTNGSTFCGRDINKESDRELMLKTIDQLVDMSFKMANAKK
ncbi:TetR/AcrR family transcriptional regulator [Rhizosphaericola mali]|uniref:TetR/AcrR family transcriptional regulator n=1 Tax=Rhizosphaericola mali TaxID=2545455 RepID=A0A5P2G9B3_9BACT|nr:TetR/AcrR family transcriptional regulator [Rhizosphaericola mali]QES90310.1 TetR/AcrR family transcriptional regulator [Rhizosphaericola mali]